MNKRTISVLLAMLAIGTGCAGNVIHAGSPDTPKSVDFKNRLLNSSLGGDVIAGVTDVYSNVDIKEILRRSVTACPNLKKQASEWSGTKLARVQWISHDIYSIHHSSTFMVLIPAALDPYVHRGSIVTANITAECAGLNQIVSVDTDR